jgi:fatty acid desaturase
MEVSWMRESSLEDARADFAAHAAMYTLVMTALIVLNFSFLTGFWWSVVPVIGFGVALALHYRYLRRIEQADADRRARAARRAATVKPAA